MPIATSELFTALADPTRRALTQGPLIGEWLMQNDFVPLVGHSCNLRSKPSPHWNGVVDCEVLEVEPDRRLSYSWNVGEQVAAGLKSIVIWTLTPINGGTHVRMEQSEFQPGSSFCMCSLRSIISLLDESGCFGGCGLGSGFRIARRR